MTKKIKHVISAIIGAKFKYKFPETLNKEFQDFLIDGNYTEQKYEALEEQWGSMEDYKVGAKELRLLNESRLKLGHKRRITFFRSPAFKVAAAIIPIMMIAGGMIFFGDRPDNRTTTAEWIVENGKTENVSLPDSSQIWINSGSEIHYECPDDAIRIVELTGESYFSVTKDPKRPFVVKTDDFTVTALGTKFNVEAYSDRNLSVVTLDEGKISVKTNDGKESILVASQQFVYNKTTKESNVATLDSNTSDSKSAWKRGKLICDQMTMAEILKAVERKYDVVIKIDNSVRFSDKIYITEFLSTDTPREIMEMLTRIGENFKYEISSDTITIKNSVISEK